MMDEARASGVTPEEHYSEKDSTAEDGKSAGILMCDISRQQRRRMALVSADAGNCYNRIHHCIMSLCFLAATVSTSRGHQSHNAKHSAHEILPPNWMGGVEHMHRGRPTQNPPGHVPGQRRCPSGLAAPQYCPHQADEKDGHGNDSDKPHHRRTAQAMGRHLCR